MRLTRSLFLLTFMVSPSGATAAADNPALTLVSAENMAVENNLDIIAAKSDVQMALAQQWTAKEFPNPTLGVGTTKVNVDRNPSGTPLGNSFFNRNYDSVVALSQLIEIGRKREFRQSSADYGALSGEARFADTVRLVKLAVAKDYITALLSNETAEILRQSAEFLRKEQELSAVRLHAGDISKTEANEIRLAADRLSLDAKSASASAVQSRISLGVLLGLRESFGDWPGQENPGQENLEQLASSSEVPPREASELLDGTRADIAAAKAAVGKAQADLSLQRALRIPDPTVSVQYEREPPDQPNTVGLAVSFPLPIWNQNQGAILSSEATLVQAKTLLEKVTAQARADRAQAESAYMEAHARFLRYRTELLQRSAENREAISYAFRRGGASLVDLLAVERSDNEVRLAFAQAAADTAQSAAALRAAVERFEAGH